jgi:hypothetical protein
MVKGRAGTIHRASASVLENSIFQVANAALLWDQMTNRFRGLGIGPDSEIAALQGGFFVSSAGRRITPGCNNFPPTTAWAPQATAARIRPQEKISADQMLTKIPLESAWDSVVY